MPFLRDGDLLFNAIVLRFQMSPGMNKAAAVADIRGHQSYSLNVLGPDPDEVARRVFGAGTGNALELLQRHTMIGIYGRAMTPESQAAWVRRLTNGRRTTALRPLGLHTNKTTEICCECLRSCPACVDSDIADQGFATWRVWHQIPAIDRCPFHGNLLAPELAPWYVNSKHARLWPLRFPTGRGIFKSILPIPMSDGYGAYLKLWPKLFFGNLPELQADRWSALVNTMVCRESDRRTLQDALERQIERTWNMGLSAVARALSLAGAESFVEEELALRTQPRDVARRLVVFTAATQLGLVDREEPQLDLQYWSSTATSRSQRRTASDDLANAVIASGFRVALAHALVSGKTVAGAARCAGERLSTVIRFVSRLPTEMLERLEQTGGWRSTSWIVRELARRRRFAS